MVTEVRTPCRSQATGSSRAKGYSVTVPFLPGPITYRRTQPHLRVTLARPAVLIFPVGTVRGMLEQRKCPRKIFSGIFDRPLLPPVGKTHRVRNTQPCYT